MQHWIRVGGLTLVLCVCLLPALCAELLGSEYVDSLFQEEDNFKGNPPEAEEEPEEVPVLDLDELTGNKGPQFSGKVSVNGGVMYGWTDWPYSDGEDGPNLEEVSTATVYSTFGTRVALDVRPNSYTRFYSSFSYSMDQRTLTFSGISVGSTYLDYTYKDNWFFRIGKQGFSNGQGRILNNPGNLFSAMSSGVAVRMTVPVWGNSLNTFMFGTEEWLEGYLPTHRRLAFGFTYNKSFDAITVGTAAWYRHEEQQTPFRTSLYVKGALAGIDLAVEGSLRMNPWELEQEPVFWTVANAYWEDSEAQWRLGLEHQYGSGDGSSAGHRIGAALRTPAVLGWRPAIRWRHSLRDWSGEVVTGLSRTIAPGVSASLGVPVVYGLEGSLFQLEDAEKETDVLEQTNPDFDRGYVAAIIIKLGLSFSF
ncbi:MAG: hypothetical protein D6B26_05410 [Spirochaetaceae bacterium]|nr:MAG: hypothetical protein D6B26_05410 [Spirochaetaceae bacterium]